MLSIYPPNWFTNVAKGWSKPAASAHLWVPSEYYWMRVKRGACYEKLIHTELHVTHESIHHDSGLSLLEGQFSDWMHPLDDGWPVFKLEKCMLPDMLSYLEWYQNHQWCHGPNLVWFRQIFWTFKPRVLVQQFWTEPQPYLVTVQVILHFAEPDFRSSSTNFWTLNQISVRFTKVQDWTVASLSIILLFWWEKCTLVENMCTGW